MNKLNLPTVIIPVKGGLGNQMFFYAFSLYLKANGVRSLLVWHEYIFTKQHNGVELLEAFDISIDNYSKRQISFFLKINKSFLPFTFKRILACLFRSKYFFVNKYKQFSPYNFDDVFIHINGKNVYMDGFWQNYQYLSLIRDKVIGSFNFRLPIKFGQNIYLEKIQTCNSVSIHIRRGDYLDPAFKDLNVIKSIDYYLRAIEYIKEKCENSFFFIFTDDVLWAKRNFIADNYIFVEGNINKTSYLDLFLMSRCKHNIIANSTFSWWGAWLNVNPTKIVVAPEMWTLQVFSSQLCPPNWIFLKA